ncbi:hypothetical protein DPEC_G00038900 [Dallia pectoralis]|uniref:Uncharacterized protein n=1 Tax=Dallia pectoralis TaxID=75939 RepID=A0ACC2HE74_DALPE|nr:hypothetical protein DPEC_G00038900 [Dallia pectoralis]
MEVAVMNKYRQQNGNADALSRQYSENHNTVGPSESMEATEEVTSSLTAGISAGNAGFTVAVPTKDQRATTIAKVVVKEWIQRYGVPRQLHSDRGMCFEMVERNQGPLMTGSKAIKYASKKPKLVLEGKWSRQLAQGSGFMGQQL